MLQTFHQPHQSKRYVVFQRLGAAVVVSEWVGANLI